MYVWMYVDITLFDVCTFVIVFSHRKWKNGMENRKIGVYVYVCVCLYEYEKRKDLNKISSKIISTGTKKQDEMLFIKNKRMKYYFMHLHSVFPISFRSDRQAASQPGNPILLSTSLRCSSFFLCLLCFVIKCSSFSVFKGHILS